MKDINTLKSKQAQSRHINASYTVTLICFEDLTNNGLVTQDEYYYYNDKFNNVMVEFDCNDQVIQYLLKSLGWY